MGGGFPRMQVTVPSETGQTLAAFLGLHSGPKNHRKAQILELTRLPEMGLCKLQEPLGRRRREWRRSQRERGRQSSKRLYRLERDEAGFLSSQAMTERRVP